MVCKHISARSYEKDYSMRQAFAPLNVLFTWHKTILPTMFRWGQTRTITTSFIHGRKLRGRFLVDSKSTSANYLVLVGPHTLVPLPLVCKKQGVVSHSSTEAEIVSIDATLHQEGLPALTCGEEMAKLFGHNKPGHTGQGSECWA